MNAVTSALLGGDSDDDEDEAPPPTLPMALDVPGGPDAEPEEEPQQPRGRGKNIKVIARNAQKPVPEPPQAEPSPAAIRVVQQPPEYQQQQQQQHQPVRVVQQPPEQPVRVVQQPHEQHQPARVMQHPPEPMRVVQQPLEPMRVVQQSPEQLPQQHHQQPVRIMQQPHEQQQQQQPARVVQAGQAPGPTSIQQGHGRLKFSMMSKQQPQQQQQQQFGSAAVAGIRRPPQQNELAQLLKDVCSLLDQNQRAIFRNFVQKLKAQRDAGQIESLTRALLQQGPRVVGSAVWQKALDHRRRREERERMPEPSNGGPSSEVPMQSSAFAQQIQQLHQQRDEQRQQLFVQQQHQEQHRYQQLEEQQPQQRYQQMEVASAFERGPRPPQTTIVKATGPPVATGSSPSDAKPIKTGSPDDELAAAPAGALTEELQRQADLFRNSDLFDAHLEESKMRGGQRSMVEGSARSEFLTAETCWHRINAAAEAANSPKFASLNKPFGDAPPLRSPSQRSNARTCGACLVLSRATWLYIRETLEALVVLSRRRRNDEAYRLASNPHSAVTVRWETDVVGNAIRAEQLRTEYRDLRYEAMLDHDIIVSEIRRQQPDIEPRTWVEAARRSRKRQLLKRSVLDVTLIDDELQTALKRVKQEQSTLQNDVSTTKLALPANFARDVVTKQDVKHYLETRQCFNSLLFV